MTARRRLLRTSGLLLLGGLVLAGCRDDRGPGTVRLEISGGAPLGAVALELVGSGIQGVKPLPVGWIEGHATRTEGQEAFRIVAVNETPGDFLIEVEVADLDAAGPSVRVLEASDGSNGLHLSVSHIQIRTRK